VLVSLSLELIRVMSHNAIDSILIDNPLKIVKMVSVGLSLLMNKNHDFILLHC
jgi:hypothetical protein